MSEFELEVRRGDLIVRVRGSNKDEISKNFKQALTILDDANKQINKTTRTSRATSKEGPLQTVQTEESPSISGAKTCRDAILKLASTPWGRTPRTQAEIRKAMELNAIYYSQPVVATELRRMTKVGLLRRLRRGDGFAYVLAKPP